MGDPKAEPEDTLGKLRDAAPDDELERAVARARVAAALFGDAEPIKIGRYALIERAGAGGMGVVWSAFDTELDRPVALKLATSGDEAMRARARDEGRALAKLSHPNVVPIYDVVDAEQGVFLVMELVKGQTLREISDTPLHLVRAYRQAGEGLAAAHAAGLIHRDFKPDNAILGADGRVRVLDFGLASASADATEIAGTPRYMAPEQRDGKPLTAAVDQYALCTSLAESLGTVPRWLEPIIARGTAEDPATRYASMDELLRALALDPGTRWRRRAVIGGAVIAVVAVVLAFTIGRAARDVSPCEGGPALIAASWGTAPRSTVAAHFATFTTPYARETAPRMLTAIDAYANGWLRLHRASCEAHRRGEISADLLDRRAGCLARRRGALATVGELAGKLAVEQLPSFEIAVGELPDLAACEDDAALVANVPPPAPAIVAEANGITELAARADVERDAGRLPEATVDADAALARARALGYRPLVARTLMSRGRISIETTETDRGAALFAECVREALVSGDDPLAIEAFARQAWAIATKNGKADATNGLPIIEAILDRAGDNAKFARALLRVNLMGVAQAQGDRPRARALLERARAEAASFKGAGAIELTSALETAIQLADDPVERDQRVAELVALRTELLGPMHPSTLSARYLGGNLTADVDRARSVMWEACKSIAAQHPGEIGKLAECGYEIAWLSGMGGDLATTREAAAIAEATRVHGGEPVFLAAAAAFARLADGDRDAARTMFVAVQAMLENENGWWRDYYMGDATAGEAISTTNPADAQRAFAKAAAHYASITSNDAPPAMLARRRAALQRAAAR